MATTLPIWDQRMFELMEYCIDNNIDGIKTQRDFMDRVEINGTSTIGQIRDGKQSFRHNHIINSCKISGASTDWIYGFTNRMMRNDKVLSPIKLLKEATRLVELELKAIRPVNIAVNSKNKKGSK